MIDCLLRAELHLLLLPMPLSRLRQRPALVGSYGRPVTARFWPLVYTSACGPHRELFERPSTRVTLARERGPQAAVHATPKNWPQQRPPFSASTTRPLSSSLTWPASPGSELVPLWRKKHNASPDKNRDDDDDDGRRTKLLCGPEKWPGRVDILNLSARAAHLFARLLPPSRRACLPEPNHNHT